MPVREYILRLTDDDIVVIKFTSRRKLVEHFVVQYYARIKDEWKIIIRADNSHGFPHIHRYYLHSKERKVLLGKDNSVVFNEIKGRIKKDYLKIKENYLNN